jgi:hypothetical protein
VEKCLLLRRHTNWSSIKALKAVKEPWPPVDRIKMTLAVAPAAVLAAATEVWLKAETARMENKKDRTSVVTFLIK